MTTFPQTLYLAMGTDAGESRLLPRMPIIRVAEAFHVRITMTAPQDFEEETLVWVSVYENATGGLPLWFGRVPYGPAIPRGQTFTVQFKLTRERSNG